MDTFDKELYYKAYVAGYRAGMIDAAKGYEINLDAACVEDIPLEATPLCKRTRNRLIYFGCKYVRDVAALSDFDIHRVRRFGDKSAAEVASYLDSLGICHSAWNKYL